MSVLFAYDAVAYYMWLLDKIIKEDNTAIAKKKIFDGAFIGQKAISTVCEHGNRFTSVSVYFYHCTMMRLMVSFHVQ